ncbi:hypothetical protein [Macrococcus armenti]|uniref:hypothetical protein n=1 Tax=Macrococcus armenti TaxID=2875764 RepID=UPI001CCBA541|nr:hypothetical protein [Macrococcus armenti]UBH16629.1 hypothetical protein LAU44_12005 [Macrococcus armenti]UBH21263.1 hypothetical protein LAU40_12040 [Macrococcus armenti]
MEKQKILFIVGLIMLLIIGVTFIFDKDEKKDNQSGKEKNDNVQQKMIEIDEDKKKDSITEKIIDEDSISESNTLEMPEKFDSEKINIANEDVNLSNRYDVAEKFVEAVIYLSADNKNEIARQRIMNLSTEEYASKIDSIFIAKKDYDLRNVKGIKANINELKTESLPENYYALRVNYTVNIINKDKTTESRNSTYAVTVKNINDRYVVTGISL